MNTKATGETEQPKLPATLCIEGRLFLPWRGQLRFSFNYGSLGIADRAFDYFWGGRPVTTSELCEPQNQAKRSEYEPFVLEALGNLDGLVVSSRTRRYYAPYDPLDRAEDRPYVDFVVRK